MVIFLWGSLETLGFILGKSSDVHDAVNCCEKGSWCHTGHWLLNNEHGILWKIHSKLTTAMTLQQILKRNILYYTFCNVKHSFILFPLSVFSFCLMTYFDIGGKTLKINSDSSDSFTAATFSMWLSSIFFLLLCFCVLLCCSSLVYVPICALMWEHWMLEIWPESLLRRVFESLLCKMLMM